MTLAAPDPAAPPAPALNYLDAATTVSSWLATTDHKRIGVMFLAATFLAMLLGGVVALILRIEHLTPHRTVVDAMTYNRLFTLHGVIMVWLFMIPAIPAGLGNFLLPLMLGAKDVAFPRLNLLSFYVYLLGAGITLSAMLMGGTDTGWTFYTPYSATSPTAVAPVVTGVFVLGISSIMSGINFIVTTHALRPRGMGWFDMPLFVWGIYATSIIQVLATPVLGLSLALVFLDHCFSWGIFDPARGGDPVLFEHLFWFYSHPAVYIMILPAMGIISEVVCTFSRKNPLSYKAIAYSSLGIALVGFLTWGHHLFVAGQSAYASGAFGIISELVAVFSAIKVVTWLGTMYRGSVAFTTPMAYVFVFLFLFVFGGMTGVAQAAMSLDVHWHDTYFIVAHFHFIMVGGTLTGLIAGLHYWLPKITGRLPNERVGLVAAALVLAGFVITFVPQFLLGNAGMPRRYYDYPVRFQTLNVISTVGSWLLSSGILLAFGSLLYAAVRGPRASANPWGSRSFEWRTSSPPITENFDRPLELVPGAYDYSLANPHE
jgi:cytochrome c oxidase subunit 1